MTEIIESTPKTLRIVYRRSVIGRIIYSAMTIGSSGFAAALLIWGGEPGEDAIYPELAPIGSMLIGILMLAIGSFFLGLVLDSTNYYFDKTADKFYLTGRRYLFRKWMVEGAVSDISGVSYEIYGQDENTSSEIFLKYRVYGLVTETIKCGTGEEIEDGIITEYIKNFLEPEK